MSVWSKCPWAIAVPLLLSPIIARGDCPALPPAYAGPLFDAMAQTDQDLSGDKAVAEARIVGVTHIALFARVHRREDGRGLVDRLAATYPDFIVAGAPKLFDMRDDLDTGYVKTVLQGVVAGHYKFVGEILYSHGDKNGGEVTASGERYIDPTRPNSHRLVDSLAGRHLPILTHWEVYDWQRDWPRFDQFYGGSPGQIFVWPHAGFGSPEQVTTVLAAHGNVWATLSKRERAGENLADDDKEETVGPPVIDACGIVLPVWRETMIRFQDRLMFATDAHKAGRWANYANVVERWRRILGQLPAETAQMIAYGNATRLYGKDP